MTETEQPSSNKRGGARPGAGRKRSTPSAILPFAETRRASVVRTAENGEGHTALEIIAKLEADFTQEAPGLLSRLLELAHGATQVTARYELAGLITLDDMDSDGAGKSWKVKTYPFSHLPKDEMVLVSRTITQMPPDRAALTYLFDRVMGKPAERKDMMTADPGNAPQGPSREEMMVEVAEMMFSMFMQSRAETPPQPIAPRAAIATRVAIPAENAL